ncbi:MAG TPA: class I SAM-dependent methyltransferase [Candidatus Paceibacterota bacterium]|nr:class I SAM-dependent methyltransferase [Candidatus Paceibacterota bacterium]
MLTRPWDVFYKESIGRILREKHEVVDIGGGLRIARDRSNRLDASHKWIRALMEEQKTSYKILDYVPDFNPDIVGDVQDLPFGSDTQEAVVCNAVLEHVENPIKAASEMHRVLKPGGYCFVYVPFLYYYHAEKGYYGDYWRFTEDSLRHIFKPFGSIAMQPVRGPLETLVRLSPLGRWRVFEDLGFLLDLLFKKHSSKQTSGYFVFLKK